MIVDAFMFYNESDVLEIRLKMLDKYVDKFILVESEVTHRGEPKPLYFDKERFAPWMHKITHIVVTADEAPKDRDPWSREKYQRHCILRGLEDVPPDTPVMISDVDEIPNLERVTGGPVALHMDMYVYSFDYMYVSEPWVGTVICTCADIKHDGPNYYRDMRWKMPIVPNAGWHLSSFGDAEYVKNKFHNYAHAFDPSVNDITVDIIDKYIAEGVFSNGNKLVPTPPDQKDALKKLAGLI